MNVLHTPVRFPPDIGGVESHVNAISRGLVSRGHDVTILCADTGSGPTEQAVEGLTVRRLTSPISIANTDLTPSLPVAALHEARKSDVIHTHLPTPWSADVSALAGALTQTPVVLTYHNDIVADGSTAPIAALYNASVLRMTLRLADRILVTQERYLEQSPHLDCTQGRAHVIPNGVDVDHFAPRQPTREQRRQLGFKTPRQTLFFLAVLDEYHEYKGLDVLFEAIRVLGERNHNPPKLVVGGEGPLRERYEKTARELGINDSVSFIGFIPQDDLPVAYSLADAFVLPSISRSQEGFGLVLLEALACETPVVTTDVVGIADAVQESSFGEVVHPDQPHALADAIEHVLAGSYDGQAGRQRCIDDYSWEASVDELEAVYRDLVVG